MMQITPVSTSLALEGLVEPTLNALVPNESNYSVLLMQPKGEIEGSAEGVWNKDRDLAFRQFQKYLVDAVATQADLAITPEYSMPWKVLADAIKGGISPNEGKLWVLGCESIKYSELNALKDELNPYAKVLFEPLQPDSSRFVDPLAYVFLAPTSGENGVLRTVVLVQFKTFPMGDDDHFEINGLQRGTCVYQFGGNGQSINLVSLICSDAFPFADEGHADTIYDRALVIHIQLNPKPRQAQYRQYRDRLFRFGGNATELVCLNWAGNVHEWCGGTEKKWKNIAGSAWYLQPTQFDDRDATLCANHQRGLYYTWFETLRSHALFFNYQPATYLLQATKVVHIGVPASVSRRRGPQLTRTCIWNAVTNNWDEKSPLDDGFAAVVGECGNAKDEIQRVSDSNKFEAERILILCAGKIGRDEEWYKISHMDSCVIDTSEVVLRLTYCQDTDQTAVEFRTARLKRLKRLWEILHNGDKLPSSLKDLMGNVRLEWSPDFPHQNVISIGGQRATVVYMGDDSNISQVEATKKRIAEYLHRTSSDPDQSLTARQRLAVWFLDDNGETVPFEPHGYVKIDQTGDSSEFDIGRAQ